MDLGRGYPFAEGEPTQRQVDDTRRMTPLRMICRLGLPSSRTCIVQLVGTASERMLQKSAKRQETDFCASICVGPLLAVL